MNSVVYILTVLNTVYILFIKETRRTKYYTLQKLKNFHGFGLQGQVFFFFLSIKINFKNFFKGTKGKLYNRYARYQIKFEMNDS